MIANLEQMIVEPTTVGKSYSQGGKTFKIAKADNFEYTDPIDKSVSKKQVTYWRIFFIYEITNGNTLQCIDDYHISYFAKLKM